jgi:hypothetical protein
MREWNTGVSTDDVVGGLQRRRRGEGVVEPEEQKKQ